MSERYPSDDQLRFEAFVQHHETMHAKQSTEPTFSEKTRKYFSAYKIVEPEIKIVTPPQYRTEPQYIEERPKRIEHRETEETKETKETKEKVAPVSEATEEKQRKKEKSSKHGFVVLIIVALLLFWIIASVVSLAADIGKTFGKKCFLIPLAIIGGINLFRGYGAVLESDAARFGFSKTWHSAAHFIVSIAGYIALIYLFTSF